MDNSTKEIIAAPLCHCWGWTSSLLSFPSHRYLGNHLFIIIRLIDQLIGRSVDWLLLFKRITLTDLHILPCTLRVVFVSINVPKFTPFASLLFVQSWVADQQMQYEYKHSTRNFLTDRWEHCFYEFFDDACGFLEGIAPNGACKSTGPPSPHKSP